MKTFKNFMLILSTSVLISIANFYQESHGIIIGFLLFTVAILTYQIGVLINRIDFMTKTHSRQAHDLINIINDIIDKH